MATNQRDPQQKDRGPSLKVKTGIKAGPDFQVGDMTLEVDAHGFIQDPEKWNEGVAR